MCDLMKDAHTLALTLNHIKQKGSYNHIATTFDIPEGLVCGMARNQDILLNEFETKCGDSCSSWKWVSFLRCIWRRNGSCSFNWSYIVQLQNFRGNPNFVSRMECKGHMLFALFNALKYDSMARYLVSTLVLPLFLSISPISPFFSNSLVST